MEAGSVAILADVHGNAAALDAVLRDVEAQDVDAILLGGAPGAGEGADAGEAVLEGLAVAEHQDDAVAGRAGVDARDVLGADERRLGVVRGDLCGTRAGHVDQAGAAEHGGQRAPAREVASPLAFGIAERLPRPLRAS